jgi:group I intron endonuclease
MRHGSIYIATNKHTGDQYVGQTRKLIQKRWASHWRTATCSKSRKAKFQKALLEFGQNAFNVKEVFVAFDSEALNAAEILLIADIQPAYNSSKGGKGLRPVVVSEETRRKRSEASKARWANPEWKAKTVAALKNSNTTEAAKTRGKELAKSRIGTVASEETKLKIAEAGKIRNALLVDVNSQKTRMIHEKCSAGANVAETCALHGLSKQAFYRHAKRLGLALFGQKLRRHYSDL